MKRLVENYTFSPSTKQITIVDNENITQEKLLLITNMANGAIIFNFADSNTKGSISGNVITLNYDTASMSANDKLQIWVEDTSPLLVTLCGCFNIIKRAVTRLSYDATNQLRTVVSGSVSLPTTQDIRTVTTGNVGVGDMGKPATAIMLSRQAFHSSVGKNFIRS